MYLEFDRVVEAMSDLEKAWECDPRRSDVLMMLAELEEQSGDFELLEKDGGAGSESHGSACEI